MSSALTELQFNYLRFMFPLLAPGLAPTSPRMRQPT